jgi:hypothetical protein
VQPHRNTISSLRQGQQAQNIIGYRAAQQDSGTKNSGFSTIYKLYKINKKRSAQTNKKRKTCAG